MDPMELPVLLKLPIISASLSIFFLPSDYDTFYIFLFPFDRRLVIK
jgi:hypothetical protein